MDGYEVRACCFIITCTFRNRGSIFLGRDPPLFLYDKKEAVKIGEMPTLIVDLGD